MADLLRIGAPEITVRLRRDSRARRMILRVGRHAGTASLTLPPRASLADARRFAAAQEAWLRDRFQSLPSLTHVGPGTVLPFEGGRLAITATSGRLRSESGLLHVPAASAGAAVAAFLRESARARLAAAVDRHAAALSLRPGRLTLRDPRSRWGSCTSAGDLMFSWRLVMAPPAALDYVAAHEVAHLAELNHGPRFWQTVARLFPGHAEQRRWLRQHGAGLHDFRFTDAASA